MLMRTDPFRDFDRLARQVLGTMAQPAVIAVSNSGESKAVEA
ncbi:hypothetical protein ACFYVR_06980 [Rhodococcus sp. NPDC003318]